jgi:hypothetical protein
MPKAQTDKVAEEQTTATEPEMMEVVRFIEPGVRIISAQDWEGAGVPDHADSVWSSYNDWVIPRSELGLTSGQFQRIIADDRGFRVDRVPVPTEE